MVNRAPIRWSALVSCATRLGPVIVVTSEIPASQTRIVIVEFVTTKHPRVLTVPLVTPATIHTPAASMDVSKELAVPMMEDPAHMTRNVLTSNVSREFAKAKHLAKHVTRHRPAIQQSHAPMRCVSDENLDTIATQITSAPRCRALVVESKVVDIHRLGVGVFTLAIVKVSDVCMMMMNVLVMDVFMVLVFLWITHHPNE